MTAPEGYRIRRRIAADDATLVAVENKAAGLLRDHGYPAIADAPIPDVAFLRAMMAGQEVWVAADRRNHPVGFAVAGPIGEYFHLKELSVDPAHGRKGIGQALVEAVTAEARAANFTKMSLTTFRDVPFNAPFYIRLGFAAMPPDMTPEALKSQFLAEVPDGVEIQSRILMVRHL